MPKLQFSWEPQPDPKKAFDDMCERDPRWKAVRDELEQEYAEMREEMNLHKAGIWTRCKGCGMMNRGHHTC